MEQIVNNNSGSFLGVVKPTRLAVDSVLAIQYIEKMYCFKIGTCMGSRVEILKPWLQRVCMCEQQLMHFWSV